MRKERLYLYFGEVIDPANMGNEALCTASGGPGTLAAGALFSSQGVDAAPGSDRRVIGVGRAAAAPLGRHRSARDRFSLVSLPKPEGWLELAVGGQNRGGPMGDSAAPAARPRAFRGCRRPSKLPGVQRPVYCMVGMLNSAPSLMPDGHREVTVLTFV